MATDDQILQAINKTNIELVKIGSAVETSADGIAELLRRRQEMPSNGNGWSIVTFATIILALVSIAAAMFDSMDDKMMLLDTHQNERIVALDKLLQTEDETIAARFEEADVASRLLDDAQQREISEIKNWFQAPALREDGGR